MATSKTLVDMEAARASLAALAQFFAQMADQHPCTYDCAAKRGMAAARGESLLCSCAALSGRRTADYHLGKIAELRALIGIE